MFNQVSSSKLRTSNTTNMEMSERIPLHTVNIDHEEDGGKETRKHRINIR